MGLQRLVRPECEREKEKRFSFWLSGLKAPSGTLKRDVSPGSGADPGQKPARIPDQKLCSGFHRERLCYLSRSEVSIDTTYSVKGTKWSLTVFLEEPDVCFSGIVCPFNCMLKQDSLS